MRSSMRLNHFHYDPQEFDFNRFYLVTNHSMTKIRWAIYLFSYPISPEKIYSIFFKQY
jgi:hypothetical protein